MSASVLDANRYWTHHRMTWGEACRSSWTSLVICAALVDRTSVLRQEVIKVTQGWAASVGGRGHGV